MILFGACLPLILSKSRRANAQIVPPLILKVNSLADNSDFNVGDGSCDSDGASAGEQCTLRAAVQETNARAAAGQNTISFDPALNLGTVSLNTALPEIATNLVISGPGANLLRIQRSTAGGTPNFRVLKIRPDGAPSVTVTIFGLTIANGNVNGGTFETGSGGGIWNRGTLTIDSCIVTGNQANFGGGVVNLGTLTIVRTTIANNTTTENGGGLGNVPGDAQTSLTIEASTISDNGSSGQGGGIFNSDPDVIIITNTTISSNSAFQGAGISNLTQIHLNGVTVTANNASSNGGGIRNAGVIVFTNTILAGNNSPAGPDGFGFDFGSLDYNLIGNTSGMQISGFVSHNLSDVNPRLGPLAHNGGLTRTHELLDGSPAIDAGLTTLITDQRGSPKPIDNASVPNAAGGDGSDIGAYETPVFEVNSTADTNDGTCTLVGAGNGCTLREAITAANTAPGTELITFKESLTALGPTAITLLSALPDLTNMTIAGPGANLLTVQRSNADGTPNFRIFTINSNRTVNISDLTIANGNPGGDNGGGVYNNGSLTMANCNIYGNKAGVEGLNGLGGGVYNEDGSLTLINCNIGGLGPGQPNASGASGGGIFHNRGTTLMTGGSIVGNSRGGIFTSLGTVTLIGVAITDNTTPNSAAGVRAFATTNIVGCLIANNTSGSNGGGIQATLNTTTVINSTISGNRSLNTGGGGIDAFNGTIVLMNSTVTNNRSGSANFGGGILVGGAVLLHNTIVAGNFRDSIPDDIWGFVNSNSSHNVIGVDTNITGISNGSNGNQIGTAATPLVAQLGPLSDNGGPTLTHALLLNSPALDKGDNSITLAAPFIGPPFIDQRGAGFSRIVDGPDVDATATVDVGSFEQQVPLSEIANANSNEDMQLIVPFHVGDRSAITSITATSSNQTLVPNHPNHLHVTDAGSTELIIINPAANQNGSTEITVTVNTSGGSTSRAFTVTIDPVNDAPSFDRTVLFSSTEDEGPITREGFAKNISAGPPDEAGQTLTFQVINNSNPSLFASLPAISPTGTLTYTSAPNANGSAMITVVLKDNGGVVSGGQDTSKSQTFIITVDPVNDAPVNAMPGQQNVIENSALLLSALNFNRISISDVDAGNAAVQTALTVNNGVLTLSRTTGLTFITGTGTSDSAMTFRGTIANINAALDGMVYTPTKGFSGLVTLEITTNDLGASGFGTALSDTDVLNINVLEGGSLQFSSAVYPFPEDVTTATVSVQRLDGAAGATSLNFATSDGTATGGNACDPGVDYIRTSGTLSWTNNDSANKTFVVLICNDSVNEETETINLTVSGPIGSGALGAPDTAVLNIVNDDAPVLLTETGQSAVALDSVILTRDPFSLVNLFNFFSNEQRRRISLFVWKLGLLPSDNASNLTVVAEDDEGRTYPLAVEHVSMMTNPADVAQVVVILPDNVIGAPRNLWVKVQLRGPASNQGTIRIAAP